MKDRANGAVKSVTKFPRLQRGGRKNQHQERVKNMHQNVNRKRNLIVNLTVNEHDNWSDYPPKMMYDDGIYTVSVNSTDERYKKDFYMCCCLHIEGEECKCGEFGRPDEND